MADEINRCGWCLGNNLYERYHDDEWGLPTYDDHQLFELLLLEGAKQLSIFETGPLNDPCV